MTYLMNIDLLNMNEIISEMIHLSANHCGRYVDTKTFRCF